MENKKHSLYNKPAIVVYDYVLREKGYCPDCHTTSSIRHGHFICSDSLIGDPGTFYREPEAPQRCKTPLEPEEERVLEA
jgi:hypothetical protein